MKHVPLGIGDRDVPVPSHICLFYNSDDELRDRLGFLAIGLDDPDQVCVLFGTHKRLAQIVAYLVEDTGRDIEAAIAEKRLVLIDGASTGDATLAHVGHTLDEIAAGGTKLIRFLGFIGWDNPEWPDEAELLAFESKVNLAVTKYPAIILCSYQLNALRGRVLFHGGIETHPMTVVGTRIHDNPHYLRPEEYLVRLQDGWAADAPTTMVPLSSLTEEQLDEIVTSALRGAPR